MLAEHAEEVWHVVRAHLCSPSEEGETDRDRLSIFLSGLRATFAYDSNREFRELVDELAMQHEFPSPDSPD